MVATLPVRPHFFERFCRKLNYCAFFPKMFPFQGFFARGGVQVSAHHFSFRPALSSCMTSGPPCFHDLNLSCPLFSRSSRPELSVWRRHLGSAFPGFLVARLPWPHSERLLTASPSGCGSLSSPVLCGSPSPHRISAVLCVGSGFFVHRGRRPRIYPLH